MKINFALLLIFFVSEIYAQQASLAETEKELAKLGMQTVQLRTEEERLNAGAEFALLLDEIIGNEESYTFPFSEVKNLSKLIAPDESFRFYTWSIPLKNGSFNYYGRLVLKLSDSFKVIDLSDTGTLHENIENKLLRPEEWYGAVYYRIIKTKHKKTSYYTLMGYRPNQASHNEKILEVLSSENMERLRFGGKIFNTPVLNGVQYKRPPYRLPFRYNPRTVATVRYLEKEKRIIMDHLAPPDASLYKKWRNYGPDFTYDALTWNDGMWQLEEGIKITGDTTPTTTQPVEQGLPDK